MFFKKGLNRFVVNFALRGILLHVARELRLSIFKLYSLTMKSIGQKKKNGYTVH